MVFEEGLVLLGTFLFWGAGTQVYRKYSLILSLFQTYRKRPLVIF